MVGVCAIRTILQHYILLSKNIVEPMGRFELPSLPSEDRVLSIGRHRLTTGVRGQDRTGDNGLRRTALFHLSYAHELGR